MRELIYLSERKLAEFRPQRRRWFRVREIGVPGVGQVGIEQPADSHLDEVIDHLSGIARWYQEDGLGPGEWVQFETAMSYLVLELEDLPPILVFAEAPGGRRLILHGSPEHLIGAPAPPAAKLPWLGMSRGPALQRLLVAMAKRSGAPDRLGR
ncbi:SAVMC3_10250 family protein, partial [Actinophytocola sp.]|uniref:SAVMC3_10250 family protein n=1 Tax=Actinophytocola sp. TaxID=1872138 RepID=UPI00389A9E8F